MLQEFFRAHFFGLPFRSNGSKIHLDAPLSENFIDYFPSSKNGMTVSVSTQKLFHAIVRSKSLIEKLVFNIKSRGYLK